MFIQKNALIAVAVSLMLAACGGGGGSSPSTSGTSATGTGSTGTSVTADPLRGFLRLTSDQLQFSNTIITSQQLATIAEGAGPFAKGTNAPLTKFAFRVSGVGMDAAAAQSKTGRFAIDLTERAASAGATQAEVFQIMVDQVTLNASAAGAFSVAVPAGAKAYIYYKPAVGAAVNVAVDAASLISLAAAPDGDTTSSMLTFDLDTAAARAIAASTGAAATTLGTLKDIAGQFDMKATISNVEMRGNNEATVLTGQSITVTGSNQPAVTGSGVAGSVQFQ